LTKSFFSQIEHTGQGDLILFRDAVLTYCAALKLKLPFTFWGSPEAVGLVRWMNMKFEEGSESGRSYLDPSRESEAGERRLLVSGQNLPSTPLSWYRDQGYLGTTLFAALVRSSYGPDEPGFFPTQSELGFYFSESKLLSEQARWDDQYLSECQSFFFEELTPAELVEQVYSRLGDEARERGKPYTESLEGVAFLVGEQTETLVPLTEFFRGLLLSSEPWPELQFILTEVDEWNEEAVQQAWEGCERSPFSHHLFESIPVESPSVLTACGPELLGWRAGR
jgi:hypothetical protein